MKPKGLPAEENEEVQKRRVEARKWNKRTMEQFGKVSENL